MVDSMNNQVHNTIHMKQLLNKYYKTRKLTCVGMLPKKCNY